MKNYHYGNILEETRGAMLAETVDELIPGSWKYQYTVETDNETVHFTTYSEAKQYYEQIIK